MAQTRVRFIHAPDPIYSAMQNSGVLFMPVWAYTLAAHIPDDGRYRLALYDSRFQQESEIDAADVYFFSGINQDFANLSAVRDRLKARFPLARFIVGGPICWSFDQAGDLERLAPFDHIVIGDGEAIVADLVDRVARGLSIEHVVRNRERFDITRARAMHRPLLDATIDRYYGAVIEVSRGCPFLCEFCDIRVLPDNNRPHNKSVELIIDEIDHLSRIGVSRFLLACDNFIGEPRWAEAVVDRILEWQAETGFRPSMYTWLTINLWKLPGLMRKMRRAGFDMLFIGVESFDSNSLLETAKVQNKADVIVEAIREIQSYGFFIIGGLIFGFDSDGEDCFDTTLNGIVESGLLSGDPSLLTALPGTPLYRRMQMSGRLRDVSFGLGGYKYQTNIRYLLPRAVMIAGFQRFVGRLIDGSYQYARLKRYFDGLDRGNFIALEGQGYADLGGALKTIMRNRRTVWQIVVRVGQFVRRPSNLYWLLRAIFMVTRRREMRHRFGYLGFWWVLWTTVIMRYQGLTERDFDVESVDEQFDLAAVLPDDYSADREDSVAENKAMAQRRYTVRALQALLEKRASTG